MLTVVFPDQNRIQTRTFHAHEERALTEFIQQHQGVANVYFTVNPTRGDVTSKPAKRDIAALDWLHVDIDPAAFDVSKLTPEEVTARLEEERGRILQKLRAFSPPPTLITDSGGGYQGFWRLSHPQDATDESTVGALEAYNRQIEHLLGGDHCHNIDRIMRVPGTVNIPDARKRKKGRVIALASVVEWHAERAYPLELFTPAPAVQSREETPGALGGGSTVKISSNLKRYMMDELPPAVRTETKALIVQGKDLDNPNKYPSRSELLFRVILDLVRAGCDDDTVASVITDPDNGISESVLDKPRPEVYAARQIARAREFAISPHLQRLNEKHAVIGDIGGKCRIISEVYDEVLKRTRISRQSFEDFRNRYSNVKVEIGQDKKGNMQFAPLGTWWLAQPERRQYETIVFAPGREIPSAYNLWQGFAVQPRPGDCSLYLQHLKRYICSGDEVFFSYLISWMARAVQMPACAGEVAVVLKGKRGAGKGTMVKWFGKLFGRHFLQVSNSSHLVGNFNAHLQDCVVLFGDEAFFAGDKRHEAVLKTLVTEETIPIEAKGVDVITAPNYTHILLASNSDWVVPAGPDERRWFVLEVDEGRLQDITYFNAIDEQMSNGGLEALLHMLMMHDIRGFNVRTAPKTEALRDQQLSSMSTLDQWWMEKLQDGRLLEDDDGWTGKVQKIVLHDDYHEYCKKVREPRPATPTALGRYLKRACPKGSVGVVQESAQVHVYGPYGEQLTKMGRPYFYVLPGLAECRESFERVIGAKVLWQVVGMPARQQEELAPQKRGAPF